MHSYKFFLLIIIAINIFSCSEKTTYSGRIIADKDLTNMKLLDKKDLINKLGKPSYIDSIHNKYFYYTEMKKSKNFYNQKKEYSYLFIFDLDKNDRVLKSQTINLLDLENNNFNKNETINNITERGLIEKIFGGVGPNQLPNSQ